MPFRKRSPALVVAGLFLVGAFGSACAAEAEPDSAAAASSSPVEETSTAPLQQSQSAVPAPPAPTTPTTPAVPAVDFAMPDVVGMDLQSAQNLVQTHNVWLSVSHDLLGSRNQVLDSGWIVCDQNIAPGQRVTGDVEGAIDFGVVKRGEVCP
ncbi:hypothetical protein [Blastococcus sp. SYSU DS0617]